MSTRSNTTETFDPLITDPTSNSSYAPVQTQPAHAVHGSYPEGNDLEASQGTHLIPRPPAHRWRDSICDWYSNLYPSCYCMCCCCYGMWLQAQMGQKLGYSKFKTVIYVFIFFWIIALIIQLTAGHSTLIWLPMIIAFIYSLCLRMHIVKTEEITECQNCPMVGEFCIGFWCWYCSVAQMARHVYGYNKVLDGDGDIDRPDNYLPIQV